MTKVGYDRTEERQEAEREIEDYLARRRPSPRPDTSQARREGMRTIRIEAGQVSMLAELNQSDTANAVWEALPIESKAMRWGEEVYFEIPVDREEENAQPQVSPGTIAFWPTGHCFCIFFGQTPASPVNLLGELLGDPNEFGKVKSGEPVSLTQVEE